MTVTLEKLGGDTRNSFIEKLKESFDAFVEENPGTPEGPVISCGEIEASLNRPGTEAYWALRDGQRVGGIVLIIDAERARGDIELLFVVNGLKGKSVGADIVAAAEGRYPSVKTWELYTPYVETRNIHFYVNPSTPARSTSSGPWGNPHSSRPRRRTCAGQGCPG